MSKLSQDYHEECVRHTRESTYLFINAVMDSEYELAKKIDEENKLNSFQICLRIASRTLNDNSCPDYIKDIIIRHRDLEEGTL